MSHLSMRGVALAILSVMAISKPSPAASITSKSFGENSAVNQITLTNDKGSSVSIITYGATVTNLMVPDKDGRLGDVVLGFDNLEQYQMQSPYFGAIIGRFANRIANGMFSIDEKRYCVPVNNGPNSLHGGMVGYDKRIWNVGEAVMTTNGPAVRLTLQDNGANEGYPGIVNVTVIYSLSNDNVLEIQYYANTDTATPINLTNHSYFNLKDGGKTNVFDSQLKLFADRYTPVDETQIPTGKIVTVRDTPIDFTETKAIGKDLKDMGKGPYAGYDHNLVLNNQTGKLAEAAEVYEPTTGRTMQVWTTEPGMQFYTANFLDGSIKGKGGTTYGQYSAFAMECQHYPDSPNQPGFPSSILYPGQVYRQITEYRFGVAKMP